MFCSGIVVQNGVLAFFFLWLQSPKFFHYENTKIGSLFKFQKLLFIINEY